MRIARAMTVTKTGNNSAPHLLHISVCIICFLALGQFGVWLCYRLFGMSSLHSVVWCTYCFWIMSSGMSSRGDIFLAQVFCYPRSTSFSW